MRHLVLSFLVLSVNSFPQDLHGRFADDYEVASNSENSDSNIFTNPAPADGSSDLFGSTLAAADGPGPINTDYLGESPPPGTLDSAVTSPSPPNAAFDIAALPQNPQTKEGFTCGAGTALACCFHSDLGVCIWYNEIDPVCAYDDDLRCCQDIVGENGVECNQVAATSQGLLPMWNSALDFLRIEVPTGWLAPLVGGVGGGHL